ncbi:MAG: hypothetical protein FWE95_06055 [Planctomycetaceae bacterium]|nr:hypothetical protein [Planctomycetaceae bacterium]
MKKAVIMIALVQKKSNLLTWTGTFDLICPSKLPHHFVTFGVIDQSVNVNSHLTSLENSAARLAQNA